MEESRLIAGISAIVSSDNYGSCAGAGHCRPSVARLGTPTTKEGVMRWLSKSQRSAFLYRTAVPGGSPCGVPAGGWCRLAAPQALDGG